MSRFDPATYPGRRPLGPVLVYQGREWRVVPDGDTMTPVSSPVAAGGAPVLEPGAARWMVAYGSNACPDRLIDKLLDLRGALLLPARLHGWRPVWEARRGLATGAVPLTVVPAPGATVDTWVLGVHHDDLDALDRSEGRGERYVVGHVGHVAVAGRWLLPEALAYGPAAATTVLSRAGSLLDWPRVDHTTAAVIQLGDGPTVRVPTLPGVVRRGWPPTPLDDLDLFVYGTLVPGRSRWGEIESLVDVIGPATTHGWLRATFYGWPAAGLGREDAAEGAVTIHGTLVRPRDPASARRLYAITDAIEEVPDLFHRVSIRVRRPDAPDGAGSWAAAYSWAAAEAAPGTPVPDGRWRPA